MGWTPRDLIVVTAALVLTAFMVAWTLLALKLLAPPVPNLAQYLFVVLALVFFLWAGVKSWRDASRNEA
jgi:hypothetical protein